MDEEKKPVLKSTLHLASVGMAMVVSVLLGLGVGLYLDDVFGTSPWLMLIFIVFGVAAGFKILYTSVIKYW